MNRQAPSKRWDQDPNSGLYAPARERAVDTKPDELTPLTPAQARAAFERILIDSGESPKRAREIAESTARRHANKQGFKY